MNEFIAVFDYRIAQKLLDRGYPIHHLDKNHKQFGVVFYFEYNDDAMEYVTQCLEAKKKYYYM